MPGRTQRASDPLIVGVNVALAIVASAAVAALGQPGVAWPICSMVGAVYGVTTLVHGIRKLGGSQ